MKSPLFSSLKEEELDNLENFFKEIPFNKGDTVFNEGDAGDSCYIVLSGELEIWVSAVPNEPINRLGPGEIVGEIVGEMALLLGDKRTATVKTSQLTDLLELTSESFDSFFRSNTKILEYFSRLLCQRLTATSRGQKTEKSTNAITVISQPGLKGKTMVSTTLAQLLKDFTKKEVLLVKVTPVHDRADKQLLIDFLGSPADSIRVQYRLSSGEPTVLEVHVREDLAPAEYSQRFGDLVAKLAEDFAYMVLDLGEQPKAMIASVDGFSDYLIKVVDNAEIARWQAGEEEQDTVKTHRVLNLANKGARPIPVKNCDPYVIPWDEKLAAQGPRGKPLSPGAVPLHRLTRKILGKTVGLALGGGAAFGISHLGVLQVLEENDIPIDMVAGCSIGSMVACGYSAGVTVSKLIEMAHVLGDKSKLFRVLDLTLFSKPGFIGGERIKQIFAPYLGKRQRFEDLILPCQVCATDIESGERYDIGEGRLEDAFRASSSVPVVISPYKLDGKVLVDGGVCEPVPAEVVRNMGADIVIAINVVPPLKKGVEMLLSSLYRQINMFNPLAYFGGATGLPNILDITMNSMQTLQHELGNFKAISADVRINPDLSEFYLD